MHGYIVFTDIEKYSSLEDDDLKLFHSEIAPIIFEQLKEFQEKAIFWNTWGDAIVAVYDNVETAINMTLTYRNAFRETNFLKHGIKKLRPRIAANYGEFEIIFDPALGKDNVHGTTVNQTARIEPVTLPGEIFVSKIFWQMTLKTYEEYKETCRFDNMGEVTLPKKAGKLHVYRLCTPTENKIKPVGNATATTYYVPITSEEEKKRIDEERIREEEEKKLQEERLLKLKEKENLVKSINKETESEYKKSYKNIKKKLDAAPPEKVAAPRKMGAITKNPVASSLLLFIGAMLINNLLKLGFDKLSFDSELLVLFSTWSSVIAAFLASLFLGTEVMKFNRKSFGFSEVLIVTGLFTLMQFLVENFYYSSPSNKYLLIAEAVVFFMGLSIARKNYFQSRKSR